MSEMDQEEAAVRDRQASRDEARVRAVRIDALRRMTGVPERYRGASFASLDALPPVLRDRYHEKTLDLRTLIEKPGIVVLLGNKGTGKTHMACALVNFLCDQERYAFYAEATDYFLALDDAIYARTSVLAVEKRYVMPEMLVLDAMEERADTPAKDRMLVRLINKRYAAEKSTVLITNETEEQFTQRIGESVTDRILDGGCKVTCDWASLRGTI